MKIVFTGSGTGGHFYPNIAVAEAIRDLVAEQQLITPRLYYLADKPYDEKALFDNDIVFLKAPAGKVRRYRSAANITDAFVTLAGVWSAFWTLFKLVPDVIFSKGGYASVPTVLAARLLGIPVVIHESDAKPGRANLLASKSAYRIAVAFPEAAQSFPPKVRGRIAVTGIPIRKMIAAPAPSDQVFPGIDPSLPTVLILGGSSGSQRINETVLDAIQEYVAFANVIHQTGKDLYPQVDSLSRVLLKDHPLASRYHAFPFLSAENMRLAGAAASVVISRSGATSIVETSLWGKPAILIPIPEAISHDQRTNAYAYAQFGGAEVIEETNLTPHVLASEAHRIATDAEINAKMSERARSFANPDAARIIADELLKIALKHEPDA